MRVAVLNRTVNLAAAATLIFNLHDGIRQGAPQAVQVADRFHVHKNATDALERYLTRTHQALRQAAQERPGVATPAPDARAATAEPPSLSGAPSAWRAMRTWCYGGRAGRPSSRSPHALA